MKGGGGGSKAAGISEGLQKGWTVMERFQTWIIGSVTGFREVTVEGGDI